MRVVFWNVENLFLYLDEWPEQSLDTMPERAWKRLSRSVYGIKPLRKLQLIQRQIEAMDPDIIGLCEVGGEESLRHFNQLFLHDKYSVYIQPGNSDRGIDLGFLVRKGLGVGVSHQSYRERPLVKNLQHIELSEATGYLSPIAPLKFARDVAELRLKTTKGRELSIYAIHLKSKRQGSTLDPQGGDWRQAEVETLRQIIQERLSQAPESAIYVMGDFNGEASSENFEEDFRALHQDELLLDAFTFVGAQDDERVTFALSRGRRAKGIQLDYLFANQRGADQIRKESLKVIPFLDFKGRSIGLEEFIRHKENMPSDHFPIQFDIELED